MRHKWALWACRSAISKSYCFINSTVSHKRGLQKDKISLCFIVINCTILPYESVIHNYWCNSHVAYLKPLSRGLRNYCFIRQHKYINVYSTQRIRTTVSCLEVEHLNHYTKGTLVPTREILEYGRHQAAPLNHFVTYIYLFIDFKDVFYIYI